MNLENVLVPRLKCSEQVKTKPIVWGLSEDNGSQQKVLPVSKAAQCEKWGERNPKPCLQKQTSGHRT
jgi:hypothetical protein